MSSHTGKPTLITWYVNKRRIFEILGPQTLAGYWNDPGAIAALLGPEVLRWTQEKGIPSLARLVSTNKVEVGRFFFHDARYYSNGLKSDEPEAHDAKLWFPMKELEPNRRDRLEVLFNTSGLTTDSAFGALQRSPCVYVCGVITSVKKTLVEARPLVIGSLVEDWGGIDPKLSHSVEIWPSFFDAFSKVDFGERVSLSQLAPLREVPEREIKRVFAEAMLQPFVDKDWGGEVGDLFTGNAKVDGKQRSCGFMFKGPAVFRKLQPADCGKNGDQVVRLFEFPADVFVLQHCHDVAPSIRKIMVAFAVEKLPKRVSFCIIDGRATFLILKYLGYWKKKSSKRGRP